ncbi:MAG: ribosomal subunit interface protein [Algoriphagus sp. 32-45-6]|jgi:ribosomal subunit interface protein|nr:MAG: ribosomal subunit interface protein [Algoriphagus sp. 32-45-6]
MIIQLNTDKNIEGTARLESFVSEKISSGLKHYVGHITRVEVHLSDQNADKGGADDIQCKIETRLEGMKPVMVTGKSSSKEKALDEALDKMKAKLATVVGKSKNN